MIGGGEHPGTGGGCGHSLKRDHASVSPMRWPRNIPWTTLPSGLAKHHWRGGLGPRTHSDSIARRRGDSVSWHQVSGRCLARQLPKNGASRKPGVVHPWSSRTNYEEPGGSWEMRSASQRVDVVLPAPPAGGIRERLDWHVGVSDCQPFSNPFGPDLSPFAQEIRGFLRFLVRLDRLRRPRSPFVRGLISTCSERC